MGVVLANPHIQEEYKLRDKLRRTDNEEEREVISRELEITETKKELAFSRQVRQRNLMW